MHWVKIVKKNLYNCTCLENGSEVPGWSRHWIDKNRNIEVSVNSFNSINIFYNTYFCWHTNNFAMGFYHFKKTLLLFFSCFFKFLTIKFLIGISTLQSKNANPIVISFKYTTYAVANISKRPLKFFYHRICSFVFFKAFLCHFELEEPFQQLEFEFRVT